MASLHTSPPPSLSIGIFRRPSAGIYAPFHYCVTPSGNNFEGNTNLRLKKELKLQAKKRWSSRVSASNTNPPEKSDEMKSSDVVPGPPLLTILAGILVFLFISWIIGSIVMWIIGLIVHPPQLK